jgi:uncharacterized protein YraI
MTKLALVLVAASLTAGSALAGPGITTAKVNFREGPGTNYKSLGSIPDGTQVDLGQCDGSGAWCAVAFDGKNGFVSGQYLSEADAGRLGWPRTYTTDKGAEIVLYQPQITDWSNFTELMALVATEYKATKDAKPIFGVIGLVGQTVADRTSGQVVVSDIKVTQLDFSALDRNQIADLALEIGKLMPTGTVTLTEDRLTASLADYERMNDVKGLKSDPPPIFVSKTAAILVQTDGKEVVAPVKGVDGLFFVVNTNWDLFKLDANGGYYLRDEQSWLTAKILTGEWQPVRTLPAPLSKLPDDENWKGARTAIPPTAPVDGIVPKVIYSDKPAELVQFDGEPALVPVPGTGLEWASNSESDVFFRKADANWYVLFSGRWFSSASLDGPWIFATPNLPEDFQNIPDDAPYYAVRASVPGTSENAEARLKASIPETARVLTDGSVKVEVAYSGDPKFEPIEGTSLAYAVNTNDQVIQVGNKYFVLKDGVWFVGDTPTGPFAVATAVPDEIYKIPASSLVYNATYVRIYRAEEDAVWFGYTMGYLGAYLAWDTFVFGTGWDYVDYWDDDWHGGYWPYYPRPATYGVAAFYNPVRGTFGRYGYAYGPYRGIAGGAAYNPRTGTYIRGGAVAGPAGERGFIAAYNPRTGNAAIARGGHNVYGSWGAAGVKHGSEWAQVHGGTTAGGGEAARWRTSDGNHGFTAQGKGGDIYAGRDGNVYRHDDGQWQKHADGVWSPVQKPSTDNLKKPGEHFASKHPEAISKIKDRPETEQQLPQRSAKQVRPAAPENLGLDRAGRQAGNQRALQYRTANDPEFNRANEFRMPSGDGGRFHGDEGFRGGGGGFHRR